MGVCVWRGFKGQSPMLSQKVSPAIAQDDAVTEAPKMLRQLQEGPPPLIVLQ
jgi:hypothetical protein